MGEPGNSLRVGLFGGTFDPVHQGHLALARQVLERCRLDRLLFIPALAPPHKEQPAASFAHRVAMLRAALATMGGEDGFGISLIEGQLPQPSYTIHTIRALTRDQGLGRIFLVIGADMLLDLPHWYRAGELLALINLVVVNRGTCSPEAIEPVLTALDPTYVRKQSPGTWVNDQDKEVHYLADIDLPVSSTSIRQTLLQGRVPDMLPPGVLHYVKEHRLYGWQGRP